MNIHLDGDFTDKNNACKFCENFILCGTHYGRCIVLNEDVHCNDVCDAFKLDADTFNENREFISE